MSPEPTKSNETHSYPEIEISKVLGLVEILKRKDGGREDIYRLAADLQMEFGDTLTVIRGAELLSLVHTPGGDVVLEPLGEQVSRAKIAERKTIIKQQLEKIPVFAKVRDFLKSRENQAAPKSEVIHKLLEMLPNEDAEQSFNHLLNWGRYAELFGYSDDSETFYLDHAEA